MSFNIIGTYNALTTNVVNEWVKIIRSIPFNIDFNL